MSADQPRPERRGRTPAAVAAAVAAVLGVVALGGWAAASLMPAGGRPAEVVPANAIGYLSIDLDPSAAQKVEAVRLLRRFPALREELDISDRDDLRRWVFERVSRRASCPGVDYDTDVGPWIGERVGLAAVPAEPGGTGPVPLVAVQVTDADAAVDGIERLAGCGGTGEVGVAVVDDFALVSDTQDHADAIAGSVDEATLADDPDYRKWMGRVGDPGIVSVYVAPGAVAYLSDLHDRMADGSRDGERLDHPLPAWPDSSGVRRQLERLSGEFEGMAAAVRLEDGAVEVELVGEGVPDGLVTDDDRAGITDLPAGTAVGVGVSLPDGWSDSFPALAGMPLPEDVERLLGAGFAVAVDGDLDPAVRVLGDPAEIDDLVGRLRAGFGPLAQGLVVEHGDGGSAIGLDREHVAELADRGSLGEQPVFRDVVPDVGPAAARLFVDVDVVERWLAEGALPGGPHDGATANLEPLRAVGLTVRVEDDGSERALLRLTTD